MPKAGRDGVAQRYRTILEQRGIERHIAPRVVVGFERPSNQHPNVTGSGLRPKRRRCAGSDRRGDHRHQTAALSNDTNDRASRCGLIYSNAVVGRPDLAHDKTSLDCGTRLCRSGLPGLGAGCQGFRRHDRNRAYELRPLAVYTRASVRRNRLDLRLLDGTQLRCCSK